MNLAAAKVAVSAAAAIERLAKKPDNPLSAAAVAATKYDIEREVARAVTEEAANDNKVAVVDVKPAIWSKINWTQAVGILATVLAIWGIEMDAQTQVAVVAGIQGVVAVVTWVMRSFFTTTVTPASMS